MSELPPGPRVPRLFQKCQWVFRPIPFLRSCAATYGNAFTIRFIATPPMVSLAATVPRLLPFLLLLAAGPEASCAPRPPQQFQHFTAPRPLQPGHTLVVGFMGGRDSWRNTEVGVGRTARWLRQEAIPGVHVETVENLKRDLALRLVRACLDSNGDGRLQPEERLQARIVLYGQSFGGAAVVKFARQLERLDIPVLLTVQVDSVGRGDGLIPANVRTAANLYQDNGRFIRGEAPIRAADSGRTRILGNFRFDYANLDIDLSHLPWYKTIARRAHAKMDRDPEVWRKVQELLFDALSLKLPQGTGQRVLRSH